MTERPEVLGIAVAGTAFNAGYRHYVRSHLDPQNDPIAGAILSSPTAGAHAIQTSPTPQPYLAALESAAGLGWTVAFAVIAGTFAVVFACFARWYPKTSAHSTCQQLPR